jgi:single-stranded DNA-specific DHH superfamily exonuclease
MLPEKQLKEIKEELDNCNNPVFLYDNDCDGLCSFLLLYKYKKEGKGYRHQKHITDEIEMENIKRMNPDKVFILDVPANKITQDFVDNIGVPVIHIEHHINEPIKRAKTFNPTLLDKKDNDPTSALCYNAVKENLWLAVVGITADWHITKDTKTFAKKHPDLLDPKIKDPAKALFDSKIGMLGRMFNFILKGESSKVKKCINALMHVNDPYDILEQKTKEGKEIYRRFEEINKEYKSLYERAVKEAGKSRFLLFKYEASDSSFSSELSNELLYRYPKKIIFVAREKGEYAEAEVRCSVRSTAQEIRTKVLKALEGLEGQGGGHPNAAGATVKKKDFDVFLERFKEMI